MPTQQQTLESEIRGTEKAIRLLIGERKALNGRLARLQARLRLEQATLHSIGALQHGARFPDVSNVQPGVNWRAVRNAASLNVGQIAFTKITEGLFFVDAFGARRMRLMAEHQFPHRGAYHFGHPTSSGAEQAQFFLKALDDRGVVLRNTDWVWYDCEVTDGQPGRLVALTAKDFAVEIRKHVPAHIDLYGGGPFLQENGVTLDGFDAHALAAYVSNPTPFMIFGKARTRTWQFTDGRFGPVPHACPGIGSCDMNIVL